MQTENASRATDKALSRQEIQKEMLVIVNLLECVQSLMAVRDDAFAGDLVEHAYERANRLYVATDIVNAPKGAAHV